MRFHNRAKPAFSIRCTNSYKIWGIPPIIPERGSGGGNTIFIFEFFHNNLFLGDGGDWDFVGGLLVG
jgi:hypothetical protein